jgi:hypothetical protein
MKQYDKRQVGNSWEVFEVGTSEPVIVDGRPLNGLEMHRAQQAIELLKAGEVVPDDEAQA